MIDKPTIRMSGAGKCPRSMSADLLGYKALPAPAWLELAAEEGKLHEQVIKSQLRNRNITVSDEQLELELSFNNFRLLGHIDGKADFSEYIDTHLLEIKSMSQFEFDRWMKGGFDEFRTYATQVACYMIATNLKECFYVVKNRSSGYIKEYFISEDIPTSNIHLPIHSLLKSALENIDRAVTYAQENELCPADFMPESIECKRCRHNDLCVPILKELSPVTKKELDYAVEIWRQGDRMTKEGEVLTSKAKSILDAHGKEQQLQKYTYSGLVVNNIHSTRRAYDKEILEQMFSPQALLPALKTSESSYIKITDKERE